MNDYMIDLETLGTRPRCPIISIGIVRFDIATGKTIELFHDKFDISEQIEKGCKVEGSTIEFWMQQSDEARELFCLPGQPAKIVLQDVAEFITKSNDPIVWGNGSTFDISILEEAFRRNDMTVPWEFYNVMDLRTFKRFRGKGRSIVNHGLKHDALQDAIAQTGFVIEHTERDHDD